MIFVLMFLFISCKKDPCKGEPKSIDFHEKVNIIVLDNMEVCIFQHNFNSDSIRIIEDGLIIEHKYNDNTCEIQFQSNVFPPENTIQNFNTVVETEIILQYNYQVADTIVIEAKPVKHTELCNKNYYEYSRIKHNHTIIHDTVNTNCFACNTIQIINKGD